MEESKMRFTHEELNVLYNALSDYTCGHDIELNLISRLELELDITWHLKNNH